jgi:GTPase KRas
VSCQALACVWTSADTAPSQSKYYSSEGARALGGPGPAVAATSPLPQPDTQTLRSHSTGYAPSASTHAHSIDSEVASLASVEFGFDDELQTSHVYQNIHNRLAPPRPVSTAQQLSGKQGLGKEARGGDTAAHRPRYDEIPRTSSRDGRPISAVLTGDERDADETESLIIPRNPGEGAPRRGPTQILAERRKKPSILQLRKGKEPQMGDRDDSDGSSASTETGRGSRTEAESSDWDYHGRAESLYQTSVVSQKVGDAGADQTFIDDTPLPSRPRQRMRPNEIPFGNRTSITTQSNDGDLQQTKSKRKLLPRWPARNLSKLTKGRASKESTRAPSTSPGQTSLTSPGPTKPSEHQLVVMGDLTAGPSALAIKVRECIVWLLRNLTPENTDFCFLKFMQDQFAGGDDTATLKDIRPRPILIDNELVLLDIVSCSADDEFSSVTAQCIQDGDGFLLVYSVASRASFDDIARFQKEILSVKQAKTFTKSQETMTYRAGQILRPKAMEYFPIVLVGNSCETEEREVEPEVGRELARAFGCPFIEIDVDEEVDTDLPFFELVREIRRFEDGEMRALGTLVPSRGLPETERPREWLQSPTKGEAPPVKIGGPEQQLASMGLLSKRHAPRD